MTAAAPFALARMSVLAFLAARNQQPSSLRTSLRLAPVITTQNPPHIVHRHIHPHPDRRPYATSASSLFAVNYVLRYDYVPDVLEKRAPHREGHLDLAKKLVDEGKCLSGGPVGTPGTTDASAPPSGALFVFTDLGAAESFVEDDPYVEHGIVTGHSIEEWNVVVQKE